MASHGAATSMLLTYRPGGTVPDCLIRVFERANEEFKCAPYYTGQLLVAGSVQNGAKGKGGCLPTSPVLWAASFADVGLSSRGAQTSAGCTGSNNSCTAALWQDADNHSISAERQPARGWTHGIRPKSQAKSFV